MQFRGVANAWAGEAFLQCLYFFVCVPPCRLLDSLDVLNTPTLLAEPTCQMLGVAKQQATSSQPDSERRLT